MPLYRNSGASMPQAAQSAMSSATSAMAHQQKTETRTTTQKTNIWDDLYKGARAVGAVASAANNAVSAIDKGVNLYDEFQIKGAYDDIAKAFQEGGYDAIQNNPNMQNYHHSQAFGRFVKDRANTEKGFMEMMQNADALADRQYLQWRQQALATREAFQSGDKQKYAAAMQELVASSPMPYRLEADENGNFKELFRSDKEGGWTATGRIITPEQANEQMEAMLKSEQMVLRGADMKIMPANRAFKEHILQECSHYVQ